jgi:hypothetical protein
MFSAKLGKWIKPDQVASSEPGFSTNMTNSSMKKKEKLVAQILATKFHTQSLQQNQSR